MRGEQVALIPVSVTESGYRAIAGHRIVLQPVVRADSS